MVEPKGDAPPAPPPLRSVHTSNFPHLLDQLGVSLLVSTYQAGKLVVLRPDGDRVNTHFRTFNKPMGLAAGGGRLAIGTAVEVWEYHDVPAVARRLAPKGRHDACYLPRCGYCTGDVQVHEMSWAGDELWFVNTRFSCLCTLDRSHRYSFVPRWQPPFISALAPEDRCHLNGLCLLEGNPAFVTALGATDTPGGWRANKKDGGVLIEVATGKVLAAALSMPHSPRWYGGRLWLLESGTGGFGFIDPRTLRFERVVELPGFTRGLDFHGRFAFICLSQVRESNVFSGIRIAERPLAERACGVWVFDLQIGTIVAYLKFEDAVQEIFAVQVLAGVRYPDVINDDPTLLADSFVLPDTALANVPGTFRLGRTPERGASAP